MPDPAVEAALAKYLRGIAHGSQMTSNAAHRELYRMGPAVVPELERRILESDWKTLEQPEAIRLLAGLVKLLHDIDENRSRKVIEKLIRNGCHPVAKRVLRSILRFSRENFRIYESHGIEIFESKEFEEGERVPHHLKKWLGNIPSEDLTGLKRITVIPFDLDAESTSHYVPAMAAITLVWMKFFRRTNPLSRLLRMTIESTLYHEVGHHVHRHEFGQIPDQEREANRYAQKIMGIAHPYFTKFRLLFYRTLYWIRSIVRATLRRTR